MVSSEGKYPIIICESDDNKLKFPKEIYNNLSYVVPKVLLGGEQTNASDIYLFGTIMNYTSMRKDLGTI
jgi:hypothetical protein